MSRSASEPGDDPTDASDRVSVELLMADEAQRMLPDLAALLVDAVDGGASVGFLAPLDPDQAEAWWLDMIFEARGGLRLVMIAREHERLVGCAHLAFSGKQNAPHRAEVQKLIVHTEARRRGVARALMAALETAARQTGRTLLMLDTETASPAVSFYESEGWTHVGDVPDHALKPYGGLAPTSIFWKQL